MTQKSNSVLFHSLINPIIVLVISLWLVFSGTLTWAVARNFKNDVQNELSSFLWSEHPLDSKSLDGQFEDSCIRSFTLPYQTIHSNQLLPFVLPHVPDISSNDWMYGKWHLVYGYEAALGVYDKELNPLITQGNYLTFEYITEKNWLNQTIESTGYSYISLDQIPEFKDYFENTPWGNFGLDSIYRVMKMTGTFVENEFIPDSIQFQSFIDSYHPTDNPDLHRIRELEDKNLIVWQPIITENKSPSSVTIYAYNMYGYRYDGGSFNAEGSAMTLPELLHSAVKSSQPLNKHSLIESYMTFVVQNPDGLITAAAIRFWPLQYAVLRLIPYYLVSLGLVLILLFLIYRKYKIFLKN